jgi:hypothetical protein
VSGRLELMWWLESQVRLMLGPTRGARSENILSPTVSCGLLELMWWLESQVRLMVGLMRGTRSVTIVSPIVVSDRLELMWWLEGKTLMLGPGRLVRRIRPLQIERFCPERSLEQYPNEHRACVVWPDRK